MMMASSQNLQCFLNQLPLLCVTLVWTVIGLFPVTEGVDVIQLRGEVNQSVTFDCPTEQKKTVRFCYFQRDKTFVNGYHLNKPVNKSWENTERKGETKMEMNSLNISHQGKYKCVIQYTDNTIVEKDIHLTVTANYSKPTVTVSHEKTPGCRGYLVRCDSYGGYPSSKVTWKTPETWNTSHMWKLLNNSEHQDQVTQLFNVSSTACFNCSNVMQEEFLSCSVGDVMSDMVSVCEPSKEPNNILVLGGAICALVLFLIVGLLVCVCRCKKGRRAADLI